MADGRGDTPRAGDGSPAPQPERDAPNRIGNPTRLAPRRRPAPEPVDAEPIGATPTPELVEPGEEPRWGGGFAPGSQGGAGQGFGPLFAPRSFGGGRVQLWGCSPGCLIVSIVGSLLLTLLLNALL